MKFTQILPGNSLSSIDKRVLKIPFSPRQKNLFIFKLRLKLTLARNFPIKPIHSTRLIDRNEFPLIGIDLITFRDVFHKFSVIFFAEKILFYFLFSSYSFQGTGTVKFLSRVVHWESF